MKNEFWCFLSVVNKNISNEEIINNIFKFYKVHKIEENEIEKLIYYN